MSHRIRFTTPAALTALVLVVLSGVLLLSSDNAAHAQSSPSAAVSLSPSGAVEQGTEITVTMTFGGLESDADASTTDYVFLADVLGSGECNGDGMGNDRYINKVDEDPEVRGGTISAECPAGSYLLQVTINSAEGEVVAAAMAPFTITPPSEPEPATPPTVGLALSLDSVEEGETITATMSFSDLETDSDTSTTDYIFRADVVGADACEGGGMGVDRYFYKVDEDPEVRTASTDAGCPAGDYTLRARISSAANTELASASSDFSVGGPVVIEPPTLTALSISHGDPAVEIALSPAFDGGTLDYRADVDVAQVTIAPTASHADATVAYLGGNGDAIADADAVADGHQMGLGAGSNTVKVAVSKDGLTTTYAVSLFRLVTQQQNPDVTLVSNEGQATAVAGTITPTTYTRRAQSFTTGTNSGGYNLTSIGVNTSGGLNFVMSNFAATIRTADASGNPSGTVLHSLTNPSAFTGTGEGETGGITVFTAPANTVLAASTTYFVHFEVTGGTVSTGIRLTASHSEDSGAAEGWSIVNSGRRYHNNAWQTRSTRLLKIQVVGSAVGAGSAATGAPTINGTALVGETLTADKGNIADTDGVPDESTFTYQWVRVDSGTDGDISGATSKTYTVVEADHGKTLKVKVSFTDDDNHDETLTSAPTAEVGRLVVTGVAFTSFPSFQGTYRVGHHIEFEITFSHEVDVTGKPQASLYVGDGANSFRTAGYTRGTGTKTLTFRYTVQSGDLDDTGVHVGPRALAADYENVYGVRGGTIKFKGGSAAANLEHGSHQGGDTQKADGRAGVANVAFTSSPPIGDTYRLGEQIEFAITFTQVVYVTGTPQATLYVGDTQTGTFRAVNYNRGTGTNTLVFRYTVQAGDLDDNGVYVGPRALAAVYDNVYGVRGGDVTLTQGGTDTPNLGHLAVFGGDTQKANGSLTPPLVSNIGQTPSGSGGFSSTTTRRAQAFTTGTNTGGYNLTSVALAIDIVPGEPANFVVTIRAAATNGLDPSDTVTHTLTNPATFTAQSDNRFTAPENATLSAGTTYLVDVRYSGAAAYPSTSFTATNGEDSGTAAGWSIANNSRVYPASWRASGNELRIEVVGSAAASANSAATGNPAITGTAQVGQTLTAGKGSIADTNGLTKADNGDSGYAYTYQWVRVDTDNSESNITTNGTSQTYTAVAADQGKTLKVKVSFQDDAGNAESRTSGATGTVTAAAALPVVNIEAGTSPVTEGTPATFTLSRTGATTAELTVTVSVGETASMISGTAPTSVTFAVGDATKTLSVPTVADTTEERHSGITALVRAGTGYTVGSSPVAYVTVNDDDDATCTPAPPVDAIWSACLTVEAGGFFEDSPGGGGEDDTGALTDTEFTVDGTTYTIDTLQTLATYLFFSSTSETGTAASRWVLHAGSKSAAYTFTAGTTSDDKTYQWSNPPTWNDGDVVSVWIAVNAAATGAPTISGTAQVGQTLTASTSGIADTDGKTKADAGDSGYAYTYQWVRVDSGTDSDISGATSSTYAAVAADQGKTLKVKVSFQDDEGFPESRTSGATGTVAEGAALPAVTLVLSSSSIGEKGGTSTVTATVSPASATAFTVTVATDPSTPSDDFTVTANKILSFGANATTSTGTVTITAVNDDVDAADQTVTVSGTASINTVTAPSDLTLTITDDDVPAFTIEDASGGEGGMVVFRVRMSVASTKAMTVNYATSDIAGQAVAGTDYTASNGTLTFAAGETSKTISVTTTDDTVDDPAETFTMTLSSPSADATGDAAVLTTASATGTISEGATLSIANASIGEGSRMRFTVTLSEAPTGSDRVTVRYTTSTEADDTAEMAYDYTRKRGTLGFFSGQTATTVVVPTVNDGVDEEDETFTVTLSEPSSGVTITTATARGTIEDDDGPPSLRISNQREEEGDTITFGVTLSQVSGKTVTVNYATGAAGDDATAGTDYTETTGTLTFPPGEDYREISVPTLEDTTDEENEGFTVTLSGAVNATIGADIGDGTAKGTITDDDGPPTVSIADGSGSEGDYVRFTVSLSEASGKTVSVEYRTSDGGGSKRATAGIDYTAITPPQTLTFAPGETEKTIEVAAATDAVSDSGETFLVSLINPSNATPGDRVATGTINEGPVLSVSGETATEGEDITFTVTLSRAGHTGAVTVDYATSDGSAVAGADYTAESGRLTFTGSDTSMTFTVQTIQDSLDEDAETFTVTLSNQTAAVTLSAETVTGTITDDDPTPTVSIGDGSGSEGGNVRFTVSLSAASGKEVTVRYRTSRGGSNPATAGTDYTAVTTAQTLTFAPGETSKTIEVGAAEDDVDDSGETFLVTLSRPANATIGDREATGTINEGPVLSVSGETATEGEDITFTVTLSRADHTGAVTVDYATSDGSAVAGADYTAESGRLTFAGSDTSMTFTVQTIQDSLDEDAESFTVTFSNPSAEVTLSAGTVTGTITDDDPAPTVSIADGSGSEGGSVGFTVTLSAASGKEVTVRYATSNGSAVAGTDYTRASGTLTFDAGETSKTISVPATDDEENDPDETFIVTLSSPVNASIATGKGRATGTINEGSNPSIVIGVRKEGHERNRHRDGGTFYQRSVLVGMYNLESSITYYNADGEIVDEDDPDRTGISRGDDSTLDYVHRTDFAAGDSIGDIYQRSGCEGPGEFDPNRPGTYFLNDVFREIRQVNENPETRLGGSVDDNLDSDSCVNHFTVKVTVWDGTDYEYSGTAAEPVAELTCTFRGNDDGSDHFNSLPNDNYWSSYLVCTDSDRDDQPDNAPALPSLDWVPPRDPGQAQG